MKTQVTDHDQAVAQVLQSPEVWDALAQAKHCGASKPKLAKMLARGLRGAWAPDDLPYSEASIRRALDVLDFKN